VEATLEDTTLLMSDRFVVVDALRGLRKGMPRHGFFGAVGMFNKLVHIDL
jgi:hypothetical protein